MRRPVALWAYTLALFLAGFAFGLLAEHTPEPGQIIAKYESEGKCYVVVATEVEVTAEDYIGYDIGDEVDK